jgi:hypothetical protein
MDVNVEEEDNSNSYYRRFEDNRNNQRNLFGTDRRKGKGRFFEEFS